MHNADLSTTVSISPSEAALHHQLQKQLHIDLDLARKLHATSTHYLSRREYRERGEIDLYHRLYEAMAGAGGHSRVADLLGLPISRGGAGTHRH